MNVNGLLCTLKIHDWVELNFLSQMDLGQILSAYWKVTTVMQNWKGHLVSFQNKNVMTFFLK